MYFYIFRNLQNYALGLLLASILIFGSFSVISSYSFPQLVYSSNTGGDGQDEVSGDSNDGSTSQGDAGSGTSGGTEGEEQIEVICDDGTDNDGDLLIDLEDTVDCPTIPAPSALTPPTPDTSTTTGDTTPAKEQVQQQKQQEQQKEVPGILQQPQPQQTLPPPLSMIPLPEQQQPQKEVQKEICNNKDDDDGDGKIDQQDVEDCPIVPLPSRLSPSEIQSVNRTTKGIPLGTEPTNNTTEIDSVPQNFTSSVLTHICVRLKSFEITNDRNELQGGKDQLRGTVSIMVRQVSPPSVSSVCDSQRNEREYVLTSPLLDPPEVFISYNPYPGVFPVGGSTLRFGMPSTIIPKTFSLTSYFGLPTIPLSVPTWYTIRVSLSDEIFLEAPIYVLPPDIENVTFEPSSVTFRGNPEPQPVKITVKLNGPAAEAYPCGTRIAFASNPPGILEPNVPSDEFYDYLCIPLKGETANKGMHVNRPLQPTTTIEVTFRVLGPPGGNYNNLAQIYYLPVSTNYPLK